MRSTKAYEYEHVTKPVKMTVNVPFTQGSMEEFVGELKVRFRPGAKLLLVDETGEDGIQAAEVLREAGYVGVYGVLGGYTGWLKNYTTTGRRRIQGKFVSTGKEALKSGLGLDPAVASTYEENHGKVDLSLPSNRG
jgi:rhodanese-related sulfurtransferase